MISRLFALMYHLAGHRVGWISPSVSVPVDDPVVIVPAPSSSTFAPSPLVADLDVVIGVLARTEYSMQALSEISPNMHHGGKLLEAVKSLSEMHQATNLDWAEQLQGEQRTMSYFILKLRDIAEDIDLQGSPWWMQIPRSVCRIPVFGDAIKPCRGHRDQLIAQTENIIKFLTKTTLHRRTNFALKLNNLERQKIRSEICELGENLDETRNHLIEAREADEGVGENALYSRIGSHLEEYRSGLDLSCAVVRGSILGFMQRKEELNEDLRVMQNIVIVGRYEGRCGGSDSQH
ncbi:hypothetical protein CMUS01_10128 [Colletotrichum musicola]|uniref:Uncharacterized protein n=1 Tax=Colletotrichum musicola TaxID=2175873 RepID=A0A8H6N9T8_9PEZI|nr:hypothetical protein CMUS01_10128 [Colletotrichum musicola]